MLVWSCCPLWIELFKEVYVCDEFIALLVVIGYRECALSSELLSTCHTGRSWILCSVWLYPDCVTAGTYGQVIFVHRLSKFSKMHSAMPPRQKPENMSSKLSSGMDVSDQPKNRDRQKARVKPMAYRMDCMLVTPNLFVIVAKCCLRVVSIQGIVSPVEFKYIRCVVKCISERWLDDE
jgi:hypothetical protein